MGYKLDSDRSTCPECDGCGRVKCPECDGRHKWHEDGEYHRCGRCDDGTQECSRCHGQGDVCDALWMVCDNCGHKNYASGSSPRCCKQCGDDF